MRVTTYLEDARDFGRYNRCSASTSRTPALARTTVEARAVINTKIEMEAIAYKPRKGDQSLGVDETCCGAACSTSPSAASPEAL